MLLLLAQACAGQVPYERIVHAAEEPGNWLTYSGNYNSARYSSLSEINKTNVANLKTAWVYQIREPGKWETSPLVVDGIIYLTENGHSVSALDGRTGRPLWRYQRSFPQGIDTCCGVVNRGLAVLGDALFFATIDAHLVALDLRTGKALWDVTIADYKQGYYSTAAPLAVKDKIIIGISGGDAGLRGFVDAYDPKTGERIWRCWTVPARGEPASETWEGESWKRGGGATWLTGSYDPALNLIYWGTGNPWPNLNGDNRKGDNLYTSSVLAIDAGTGKIRWHFQFSPHDTHDWDANQILVLVDTAIDGRNRKLLVQANRNAFYYVIDRETGEFIRGRPYVKETWARELDARGRPVRLPNSDPTPEGALIYPGVDGGTNWYSPSYDPLTKLFYVQTQENFGQTYYKIESEEAHGRAFESGSTQYLPGVEWSGMVKALEVDTGKIRWEFPLHAPSTAGLLSTAGGIVFGGTHEGNFFALDAASGKPLWHFQTGGKIGANPITFLIDGKQYVAIAAGQGLFVFAN